MDDNLVEQYRKEFPVTEKFIYLDHAGVAPISLRVKKAVGTFLSESAEGGAFHYPGWAQRVANIRRSCAGLLGAEPDEIAFVKSTSHGLSIVANGLDWKTGDNLLVYEKEFPSNLYPWMNLRKRGVEIRLIPARDNVIHLDDIEGRMDARTRIVAVSSVQFATGFRVDLVQLGGLCRSRDVLFCVDAIQSLGVIPMDVRACNIDFLSADAHKWLLGPEGIGIFYCRRELAEQMRPPLIGWKSVRNEFAFESSDFELKADALRFEEGSMNIMGILGLGAAIDLLNEAGIPNVADRVLDLGHKIIREAESRGFLVATPKERNARGGNITFAGYFNPLHAANALREKGILVNTRGGGLRVSPHFYNTAGELERFFNELQKVI